MSWIGEHIWDFISRFRNDVYFEAVPDGTIASGKNLGLDSDNKLVKESDTGVTDLHGAGVDGAANQLLTDDGNGTVTSEANFTFDGDDVTITSATSQKPEFVLKSTTNDNKGSNFKFVSDKGGAGADSDFIGAITFIGDNSAQEQYDFCRIDGKVGTALDTDEAGSLSLRVAASTGGLSALRVGLELTGHGTDDKVDANIGYGSASLTTIAGTLTMGSTAFVNNSGVIQVATQGTIDHDSLANFVANEHIDWTGNSAGTIHSTNIPTLNQDTTGNAATATTLTAGNKSINGTFQSKGFTQDDDRNLTIGSDGHAIHVDASDLTDDSTSASGTNGTYNHITFENPRLLATNSSVTTTNASTVFIKGAPAASTNQTITNAYSLYVNDGDAYFGGDVSLVGNILPGITYVKILPSDFVPDDVGRPAMIDDTGSDRWLESHGTAKLFAYVDIPVGFKATHVDIYGSATSAVTVYEADVNSKTVTSKGTGNIGTQINITDVNSDATNYILIELAQASGEEVYGGKLTIAKI